MTAAPPDLTRLVTQLLEAAPPAGDNGSGHVPTLDLLHRLAARSSQSLEHREHVSLAMLCRKIAVAGRVWESYDPSWSKPASRSQLSGPAYSLLAAVLLTCAGAPAPPNSKGSPGAPLKYLNAALGALDLARESDDTRFVRELDDAADRMLARLVASA